MQIYNKGIKDENNRPMSEQLNDLIFGSREKQCKWASIRWNTLRAKLILHQLLRHWIFIVDVATGNRAALIKIRFFESGIYVGLKRKRFDNCSADVD